VKLLLDTNICIFIIKRRPAAVLERFREYEIGDLGISSITLSELRYGVVKSEHRDRNARALDEFVTPMEIIPFDENAALAYGEIRATLERAGTVSGSMDMLIAAQAVALSIPLVTNNTRDFQRVRGLTILDWTV
jgi:tRNA(fMet)-specific endonuclease VapC